MNSNPETRPPGIKQYAMLPTGPLEWTVAVALFLFALGLAIHQQWSLVELFWAVWIAALSLTTAVLVIAFSVFAAFGLHQAVRNRAGPSDWLFGLVVYAAGLAACVLPLGAIYWVTATIVNSAILDQPDPRIDAALIIELLQRYWPVVLAGLFARGLDFKTMRQTTGFSRDDWANTLLDMIRTAFLSSSGFVLATFIFAVIVLFSQALAIETGWWAYGLVFAAFYILPARPLPPRKPDRIESMVNEKTLAELSAMFPAPMLNLNGREHHYPDYRSLYASPEFSRFAETLRFAGNEERLKLIEAYLTQKVIDEQKR